MSFEDLSLSLTDSSKCAICISKYFNQSKIQILFFAKLLQQIFISSDILLYAFAGLCKLLILLILYFVMQLLL